MVTETATRAEMLDNAINFASREVRNLLSGKESKKIIIYGAGARGIFLNEIMNILGYRAEYFIDSSKIKQNSFVCGLPVHEPVKIMYENPEDIFVIVAVSDPEGVVEFLKGFDLSPKENIGNIFGSNTIGDAIARVEGMPLIDFFLGYNRQCDLPGFKCIEYKNEGKSEGERELRILTLGGSTTDPEVIDPLEWNDDNLRQRSTGSWPRFLSEILKGKGISHSLYNGGFSSYLSAQEVLKLFRDGLTLKPDIVIVYDGINDAQTSMPYDRKHPKFHYYFKTIEQGVKQLLKKDSISAFGGQSEVPFVNGICYGVESDNSAVEEWYINQRVMKAICSEFGIAFVSFLQPGGLYLKEYYQSCEVRLRTHWTLWNFFLSRANILQEFAGESYRKNLQDGLSLRKLLNEYIFYSFDHVEEFYTKARQFAQNSNFIVDISDTLNGHPDVLYDSAHCTSKGNMIIAERIYKELKDLGTISKLLKGR